MNELKPIIPFEPKSTYTIPSGEHWIAQVKWDGVRILTYFDGYNARLFNRRLNERTAQFFELTEMKNYCRASSIILDGEVVALKNGLPSFHEVMKRDGARKASSIKAAKQVPVFYMIFDLLFYNGNWVTEKPLKERQLILSDIVVPNNNVQLVENFSAPRELFKVIKEKGLEGIVCKDLRSTYKINGKDDRWLKIKNYKDLIAVVGGVTFRGKTVNSLMLGLYDKEGRLLYIGHGGTGKLNYNDWKTLTEAIVPLIQEESPFLFKPKRIKNAVWLKPVVTVKIKYMEWTQDGILRQPSIQAFVSVPPKDCTLEDTT